jgi:hypothetical protein
VPEYSAGSCGAERGTLLQDSSHKIPASYVKHFSYAWGACASVNSFVYLLGGQLPKFGEFQSDLAFIRDAECPCSVASAEQGYRLRGCNMSAAHVP